MGPKQQTLFGFGVSQPTGEHRIRKDYCNWGSNRQLVEEQARLWSLNIGNPGNSCRQRVQRTHSRNKEFDEKPSPALAVPQEPVTQPTDSSSGIHPAANSSVASPLDAPAPISAPAAPSQSEPSHPPVISISDLDN